MDIYEISLMSALSYLDISLVLVSFFVPQDPLPLAMPSYVIIRHYGTGEPQAAPGTTHSGTVPQML
jgi:hypothetical protein